MRTYSNLWSDKLPLIASQVLLVSNPRVKLSLSRSAYENNNELKSSVWLIHVKKYLVRAIIEFLHEKIPLRTVLRVREFEPSLFEPGVCFNIKWIGKLPGPTNEFDRFLVSETGECERPKFYCSCGTKRCTHVFKFKICWLASGTLYISVGTATRQLSILAEQQI